MVGAGRFRSNSIKLFPTRPQSPPRNLSIMRSIISAIFTLSAALPSIVSAALIPHADTPVFYLVGDDPFGDTFKVSRGLILSHDHGVQSFPAQPLRLTGQHMSATLTGEGPIAMIYIINGTFVAEDPVKGPTSPLLYHPYVDFSVPGSSDCGASGPLMFVQDPNRDSVASNPCAAFSNFFLFSDRMDNQLGAKLILNSNLTSFYACGNARDVSFSSFSLDRVLKQAYGMSFRLSTKSTLRMNRPIASPPFSSTPSLLSRDHTLFSKGHWIDTIRIHACSYTTLSVSYARKLPSNEFQTRQNAVKWKRMGLIN